MTIYKKIVKTLVVLLLVAAVVIPILQISAAQAALIQEETDLEALPLEVDPIWMQTTQADFTSGTLVQLDAATSPGDVKLAKLNSGYVYAFKGFTSKTFWRYDVATNSWAPLADAPQNVGAGGALAYDGNNYIYALSGNGQKYFWRYDINANTWSSLNSTTSAVNTGGALVYAGNNLYAFRGDNKSTFWRYSIAGGTWSSMAAAPGNVNGGGALTWGGGDFIYALKGASTTFWKYSITSNSWTALASTLSSVGDGGALASDDNKYVYALKGDNTVTFWRYDISADKWNAMADTPATPCIYGGGALVFDKNTNFFALRGNEEKDFWQYDSPHDTWLIKQSAPSAVAYGGALAYQPTFSYYTSGTLTSSTFDTSSPSDFGTLSWTASIPAATSVKFQIATNNDSATWNFKGPDGTSGTYYTSSGANIWAGNSAARYIKYKAFFGTTNTAVTPTLNDVSINYCPHIYLPAAATAAATLVEETTATLNGAVASDGGQACQYRFEYGISPGVYSYATNWTGSKTTGQTFSANISGLNQGMMYYFVAEVKNSAGTGTGAELYFLTKPEAPTDFTATIASSTQINLSWTKGLGANRTKILRKIGGFPADMNDGDVVYFSTGSSFSDSGLSPTTTYYYRAWSEVTENSLQQWSDGYASVSACTSGTATASTSDATFVEETTATLNGSVANDGGEACQYRFQYGTAPGVYTNDTGWTGSVHTGNTFDANLTGLNQGTLYYFRAQVKNSAGIGNNGAELSFLTKPEAPTNLVATVTGSSLIELNWTKGTGADRTRVMRKIGSYPTDYNDGTQVFFDIETYVPDSGLSANTTYYYRAWSEITAGPYQQWSDDYASICVSTSGAPSATTDAAAYVEEESGTLNGLVAADGGEVCQGRFEYGTTPGVYTSNTGWTGSLHTGDTFNAPLTGLDPGTKYYFVAEVKNSAGIGYGVEFDFLTKPIAPVPFTATAVSDTQIDLSWVKGIGAQKTMIRRSTTGYPVDRNDGDLVYFDTGTSFSDTGLTADTEYYYSAWSEVTGSEQWSDDYTETTAQTSPPPTTPPTTTPPTTTPPTTTPKSVGGVVYPIDKMQLIAPWFYLIGGFVLLVGGFVFQLVRARIKRH